MATKPKSTAVAKAKSTAVSTNVMSSMAQDMEDLRSRLTKVSGDRIKISNKQFTLPSGDILDFLDVVIVDFVYTNKYYEGAYEKDNIVPPNCFAIHQEPTGMVPSANSPDVQCEDCNKCWANQFGSSGKGKACQNRLLMAVLPADAGPDTPFAILDISPTAVKPFSAYVSSVARGLQRPPYGVITHVECNPSTKHDVCVFSDPQPIEDMEFIEMVRGRRQEAIERLSVEPDVAAINAANDAKPARGKAGLKAPVKRRA